MFFDRFLDDVCFKYVLLVICCLLCVVCRLLLVVCCWLFVVYLVSFAPLLFAAGCFFIVCCLPCGV